MSKRYIISALVSVLVITSLIGCGAKNANAEIKNNETQVQSSRSEEKNNYQIQTYFTRKDGNLDQILIKEINTAQKSLNIAIYSLTKDNIGNAIIDAKKRGVDIKVMTDKQESQSKSQKAILDKFKANNILVKINSHPALMHLKLTIVDNKTVCGGSYNYTANATKENDENLIIMRDPNIINDYISEFNSMWENTSDYKNY